MSQTPQTYDPLNIHNGEFSAGRPHLDDWNVRTGRSEYHSLRPIFYGSQIICYVRLDDNVKTDGQNTSIARLLEVLQAGAAAVLTKEKEEAIRGKMQAVSIAELAKRPPSEFQAPDLSAQTISLQ